MSIFHKWDFLYNMYITKLQNGDKVYFTEWSLVKFTQFYETTRPHTQ